MTSRLFFILAAGVLTPLLSLRAGVDAYAAADASESAPAPSKLKTSFEFDGDTSYVGDARTDFGDGTGKLSEERTRAHFLVEPQYNNGPIFRFGLGYQRYSFGLSRAAPLPDVLQAENLIVGADFQLFDSWLVRVEADPGFYSDARSVGFRDFNVPFLIGGSYIASEELQWVLGVDVDINRQLPVIPAVGVRWAFADNWVLNAVLPTPRLEYDWSKKMTLYAGCDIDDGTYRMDNGFGTGRGSERRRLSGAVVEYDELRVGAGLSWKAWKGVTFELEGGYLPYRGFDFHRADVQSNNEGGAPYGQMSLNAQF